MIKHALSRELQDELDSCEATLSCFLHQPKYYSGLHFLKPKLEKWARKLATIGFVMHDAITTNSSVIMQYA